MAFDDLVAEFSQSVGVEKAREMIREAAAEVGTGDPPYAHRELVDICDVLSRDYDGYVEIIARDLLVQKQAERRFYTLLESIPDPAAVVTFVDGEPIIQNVNTAFEDVFGFDRDTVTGNSVNDFIVPEEKTDEARSMDQQLGGGRQVEREVRRVTADGEYRDFLARGLTLTTDRGRVECYAIYTDITERKEWERELERQNEQLDQFASVVSHDLRNPLNVASGHLEIAMESGDYSHLSSVKEAHERMGRLIDRMLTLARKGQTVGDRERCDLSSLARDAWVGVQAHGATLTGTERLGAIEADDSRLIELFENLYRNSVEHGLNGDGDVVTITVGHLNDGDGFYVADDGPGIPPSERDAVLEHGYTTSDAGTGLGLAIVDSIADAHGWSLSVTESEDGGARIEIHGAATLDE